MVRVLGLFVLLTTLTFAGDMWTYFHPETVTKMTCSAETVSVDYGQSYVDDKGARHEIFVEQYEANAMAEHDGVQDWKFELGKWDVNDKGRDAAVDACKAWIKVAAKKVRIAHGGKK